MPKFTVKISEREVDWPDDDSLLALQCTPKERTAPLPGVPERDRPADPAARGTAGQEREESRLSPLDDPRGYA